VYWPSLSGSAAGYGEVSERLRPLTQERFLTAAVIDNPPLPLGLWWPVEHLEDDRPFMWAGPDAELWLPPVPKGTLLGIELRPAPGDALLRVEIDHGGGVFDFDGRAPATRLWTRTGVDATAEPIIVRFRRDEGYPPGGGDERQLAVQLLDVVVRPTGSKWGGPAATRSQREGLRLELDGAYDVEDFAALGRGVWLKPEARFRIAVDEAGRIVLRLAAPRPTPAKPQVLADGVVIAGPVAVDHRATTLVFSVDASDVATGSLEFVVESEAYQPSATGTGTDNRRLGVVLLGLEFEPAAENHGWWP